MSNITRIVGTMTVNMRALSCRTPRPRLRAGVSATTCTALLLLLVSCTNPLARKRVSQPASVTQTMGSTTITVTYNRPSARGRALFGALVPYGVVWDPGADEATTLEVSRDVLFNDKRLAKGRYSVWAIPDSARWTVILSSAADVEHTPYPEGKDVLRDTVPVEPAAHVESLSFYFPTATADSAVLRFHWGTTALSMRIRPPPP